MFAGSSVRNPYKDSDTLFNISTGVVFNQLLSLHQLIMVFDCPASLSSFTSNSRTSCQGETFQRPH